VSIDDSLGEKDKETRHMEAVEFHHDHTQSQGKKQVYTNGTAHIESRLQLGKLEYVFDWRLYLREQRVRKLNRKREQGERLRFRKKTSLALICSEEIDNLLPEGFQVMCSLLDGTPPTNCGNSAVVAVACHLWHQIQSLVERDEVIAMEPNAEAPAVRVCLGHRYRPTAKDLSRACQAGSVKQAAVRRLCHHQQTAPSG
jgi:hypothetical protein